MQSARPTQGSAPQDMAASLAKALGMSEAKVKAAMAATRPSGRGRPPPSGQAQGRDELTWAPPLRTRPPPRRSARLPPSSAAAREDPAWVRPALVGVLAAAALPVLWDLTVNGYSNAYYAAAAKAGSVSWKAWFFGSLDPRQLHHRRQAAALVVAHGPVGARPRLLALSILLPQALCTIASVGLLFATVRRVVRPQAGLIAAAALAITPVTVAIGAGQQPGRAARPAARRLRLPLVRAIESGRTKHLVLGGVVVGLAFMTKMLQGWMVVPALAAAYLLAGPPRLVRA